MKKITYIKSHKKILKIEVSGDDQQVDDFAQEFEDKFDVATLIVKK